MRRNEKGFTLMELMVVIVIVAILAAVAVPLYINYVKDAKRTEAKGAIGAVITAEQAYYQLKNTYVDATMKQNPGPGDQSGLNCDVTEALTNWTINVTNADANGFLVTATPIANGGADGVGPVTYDFKRTTGGTWNP